MASGGSPSATSGSSVGSPTAEASPALAVVQARTLTTRLPGGLSREVAIAVGTRVIVYGGFTSTGSTTDAILSFDPGAGTITKIGALAVPVHDAAGAAAGGASLIFGGGNSVPVSEVQRIDSNAAASVVGHLPAARADLSAVSIGTFAIVIGGGATGVLERGILGTEDGVQLLLLGKLQHGVRYAAVAEIGGLIYVIGGVGVSGDRADIQRIDPVTGKVDVIGQMPQPISHASAIAIGGRLFVIGGRIAGNAQDAILQLDVGTGTTRLVGHLPQALSDFGTAVIGGTIYVIGGETSTQVPSIVGIAVQ